jgi:hypothetical protein
VERGRPGDKSVGATVRAGGATGAGKKEKEGRQECPSYGGQATLQGETGWSTTETSGPLPRGGKGEENRGVGRKHSERFWCLTT